MSAPTEGAKREYALWARKEEKTNQEIAITCWSLTIIALGFVWTTADLSLTQSIAVAMSALVSLFQMVVMLRSPPDWEDFETKAKLKAIP